MKFCTNKPTIRKDILNKFMFNIEEKNMSSFSKNASVHKISKKVDHNINIFLYVFQDIEYVHKFFRTENCNVF